MPRFEWWNGVLSSRPAIREDGIKHGKSSTMKQRILAKIEKLAESLVLWNGTEEAALVEQFKGIEALANDLGLDGVTEAIREACALLSKERDTERDPVSPFLEQVVSGLQDVFTNGRDPQELPVFQKDSQNEKRDRTGEPITQLVDKKIFSDFLARQDGVMADFEVLILDLEKRKDMDSMREILRLMHTIKGESALLGLSEVEKICHAVEDYLGRTLEDAKIDLLLEARRAARSTNAWSTKEFSSAWTSRSCFSRSIATATG